MFNTSYVSYDIVNKFSLLIKIEGTEVSSLPYMLMGHFDVVPVDLAKWTVGPFEGVVKDDYLYGRGTIDCKLAVIVSNYGLLR